MLVSPSDSASGCVKVNITPNAAPPAAAAQSTGKRRESEFDSELTPAAPRESEFDSELTPAAPRESEFDSELTSGGGKPVRRASSGAGSCSSSESSAPSAPEIAAQTKTVCQPKAWAMRSATSVAIAFISSPAEPNQPKAWPRRDGGERS